MDAHVQSLILETTGADSTYEIETIQHLWSGYGSIVRYGLTGSDLSTIIVKHVKLPDGGRHPRGWNTSLSHERKVKSYEVETHWYSAYSSQCDDTCRVPNCFAFESHPGEVLILLEDLDTSGFPGRKHSVTWNDVEACLSWLANFHATYMGHTPDGLWKTGTYWHLETRPEELDILDDLPLKAAAGTIDSILSNAKWQTLVHGDAKLANFCFSNTASAVAAVDFQYVGGGCGMKDVAYFVGSCYTENECETHEQKILDFYFAKLSEALNTRGHDTETIEAILKEWRALYHIAWCDFHRFLKGWSPGHWKINSYSEKIVRSVVASLKE